MSRKVRRSTPRTRHGHERRIPKALRVLYEREYPTVLQADALEHGKPAEPESRAP